MYIDVGNMVMIRVMLMTATLKKDKKKGSLRRFPVLLL
jgi:hypothetical protein